jgi:hypothetical protein
MRRVPRKNGVILRDNAAFASFELMHQLLQSVLLRECYVIGDHTKPVICNFLSL